jgi:Svf1-like C-terminal lipocalin-like domain
MIHGRRQPPPKTGIPGNRRGAQLNVGLEPGEDAVHRQRGMHYEWWYFHAGFDDGHSVVAILWPMNYSKPWARQCTIQLSLYMPDGTHTKHYIFPSRNLFSASEEDCDVRIGESYARWVDGRYELRVEACGDSVELTLEPTVPGWKPGNAVNRVPFPRFNTMGWLVPVPMGRANGRITVSGKTVELEGGHGYHDHNWGEAPIFHVIDNWHWGHVVSGDLGIIWSDITACKAHGYDKTFMFLLSVGDRLVMESPDLRVAYDDWIKYASHLHPYPRRITVSFGDAGAPARGEFSMEVEETVETQDLLDMVGLPPFLKRLINALTAKPYYFRWRSRVEGWVEAEGERIPLTGHTIHEQMLFRGRQPSELMEQARFER